MLESAPKGSGEVLRHATPAEVLAAIESLRPAELLRLKTYARFRMRALGGDAQGRNYEDLMSEALTATLAGTRRWNKEAVDLVGHLCGVIRSVSSHWAEHLAAGSEIPWPEFAPEGGGSMPLDLPSPQPDVVRQMSAAEEVKRIRDWFAGDPKVTAVLDAFDRGLRGPDIKELLGLTQTEYETIMKRLRRGVERLGRTSGDDTHVQ